MKKITLILFWVQFTFILYGQIIADHTVVDKYDKIPQFYIDEVKKMWLVIAGESHSLGYREGLMLFANEHASYKVSVVEEGVPEAFTTSHLRVSRATWGDYSNSSGWIYGYGEDDWWTNPTAITRTKAGIAYCKGHNLIISAIGFGWCWDPMAGDASYGTDPVTGNHWYGWSEGSPSGDKCWGIDESDNSITGNSVNIESYINATQAYIDYCTANSIPTKVFFTTGPVDSYEGYFSNEAMYQAHLKYNHIRSYVKANSSRILFDYADILCYDANGNLATVEWNGHIYPTIAGTNLYPIEGSYHISKAGAVRLAKALWWMLARIAGWDGGITGIEDDPSAKSHINVEVIGDELKVDILANIVIEGVELYSVNGSLISSKFNNSDFIYFNIANMSPGLYILAVRHTTGTLSKKIIIP